MAHVPHVFLPPPWADHHIPLEVGTRTHLEKVLRRSPGAEVSYTDGVGRLGSGFLAEGPDGVAVVARGAETTVARSTPSLTIAVAPPKSNDRGRFIVEKLAELGVDRIAWLRTAHSEGRPPPAAKTDAWATMALEQSRGAWRTELLGPLDLVDLPDNTVYADPSGRPWASAPQVRDTEQGEMVIAIGPEGGFAPGEIPSSSVRVRLGERVLRVETAAITAAVLARVLADISPNV